jgi:1,4-alpha-glucan branching enzyme
MGNEFGHPEWIDFPRQGNQWSYRYARRQWHLKDDPGLKYHQLDRFDKAMIALANQSWLLTALPVRLVREHNDDKVIIFERAGLLFAFNFHPTRSLVDYAFYAEPGCYRIVLDSDAAVFGGHGRIDTLCPHFTMPADNERHALHRLSLYLPNRTALVLEKR